MRIPCLGFALLVVTAAATAQAQESHTHVQAQLTLNAPTHDLGAAMDHELGYGIGLHWLHARGEHYAHRTRFDWNVWGKGDAVDGVRTQVSNYTLAFDHLYHFDEQERGLYILGGLGAVRWFMEEDAGAASHRFHTTKLAATAGGGYQFNPNLGLEVRYQVSSVRDTFDSNVVQTAFVFRF